MVESRLGFLSLGFGVGSKGSRDRDRGTGVGGTKMGAGVDFQVFGDIQKREIGIGGRGA